MHLHVPLDGNIKALHIVRRLDGSLQVTPLKTDHQVRSMYFASQDLFTQENKAICKRLQSGYAVCLLAGKNLRISSSSEVGELLLAHSEDIINAGARISRKQKLPEIAEHVPRIVPAQIDTSLLLAP